MPRTTLPDIHIHLRDAADFILDSHLARKALEVTSITKFPVFLRDLIAIIYRLTTSCHMPEFTDHGLSHLCSLIDRISRWTCAPHMGESHLLSDLLEVDECAILLVATLLHDIGMLSQRPEDLDEEQEQWQSKGQTDIPAWVRKTHVARLEKLSKRLFDETEHSGVFGYPLLKRGIEVAKSHAKWPWQDNFLNLQDRDSGLAAVLAVSDLLDEDSNRCDTMTLLNHRQGTILNRSHWIRHNLTSGRILIDKGKISVNICRPPGTDSQLLPLFSAIRNHFRLIFLYNDNLSTISAGLFSLKFNPETNCPVEEAIELRDWDKIEGLATQKALLYNLFESFFPEALLDENRLSSEDLSRVESLGMENIDLSFFYQVRGELESRSHEELTFYAVLNDQE